ncbi:hypothetical protein CF326_g9651, partial [Tilletia indica]
MNNDQLTAAAIARDIGLLPRALSAFSQRERDALVMTATQFDKLSDAEINALTLPPFVLARCSTSTKVRLIEALHRRERFCAMTGDGVNDAPSLKMSKVGIATSKGSDVAKDAAALVLTDDNFKTIESAVEEGRRISDNVSSFLLHLLAQNVAQADVLRIGLAFKDASSLSVFPPSPVEILYAIMITSGLPAMRLGLPQGHRRSLLLRIPDSNEDLYSYFLVTEPTYSPRHVASIALLKRVQILDSSAPLQQQLNIISLPVPATGAATAQDADGAVNGNGVSARDVDGEGEVRSLVRQSPYKALHSVVHNVMAPWFDAYVSSKESRNKDAVVVAKKKDADSKLGIPMARRKFAE